MLNTEAMTRVHATHLLWSMISGSFPFLQKRQKMKKRLWMWANLLRKQRQWISHATAPRYQDVLPWLSALRIPLCKMFIQKVFDGKSPVWRVRRGDLNLPSIVLWEQLSSLQLSRQLYITKYPGLPSGQAAEEYRSWPSSLRMLSFKDHSYGCQYMKQYMESLDY